MSYIDPNTIHNPVTGTVAPAAWGDQIRDNLEFLVDPPACSVTDLTGTSVPSNTLTVLGGTGTENFDNDAMHSDVTNRGRITIQTPGRYLFLATIAYTSHTGADTAFIRVSLRVNGTTSYAGMIVKGQAAATSEVKIQATRALPLVAGDYVEITTLHTLVGTVNPVWVEEFFAMFLTR